MPSRRKLSNPAAQREAERHVRVEPADDVARGKEAQVPRRRGAVAVLRAKIGERARIGRVGPPDEVVEDAHAAPASSMRSFFCSFRSK